MQKNITRSASENAYLLITVTVLYFSGMMSFAFWFTNN